MQTEGPWALGDLAATLVDAAALDQLLAQFPLLDTPAKLKILTALAALRRRDVAAVADQLDRLVATAAADPEPWVKVTARMLAPLPRRPQINDRADDADDTEEDGSGPFQTVVRRLSGASRGHTRRPTAFLTARTRGAATSK